MGFCHQVFRIQLGILDTFLHSLLAFRQVTAWCVLKVLVEEGTCVHAGKQPHVPRLAVARLHKPIPVRVPYPACPGLWRQDQAVRRWNTCRPTSDENRLCGNDHCRMAETTENLPTRLRVAFCRSDMSPVESLKTPFNSTNLCGAVPTDKTNHASGRRLGGA